MSCYRSSLKKNQIKTTCLIGGTDPYRVSQWSIYFIYSQKPLLQLQQKKPATDPNRPMIVCLGVQVDEISSLSRGDLTWMRWRSIVILVIASVFTKNESFWLPNLCKNLSEENLHFEITFCGFASAFLTSKWFQ